MNTKTTKLVADFIAKGGKVTKLPASKTSKTAKRAAAAVNLAVAELKAAPVVELTPASQQLLDKALAGNSADHAARSLNLPHGLRHRDGTARHIPNPEGP